MHIQPLKKFWVAFYQEGMHDKAFREVTFTTTLPELPEKIKEVGVPCCCWEAWDKSGQVLTYALCKYGGDDGNMG